MVINLEKEKNKLEGVKGGGKKGFEGSLEGSFQDMKIMTESIENKRELASNLSKTFKGILEASEGNPVQIENPNFREQKLTIEFQNGPRALEGKAPRTIELSITEKSGKGENIFDKKTLFVYLDRSGNNDPKTPFGVKEERVSIVPDVDIERRKKEERIEKGAAEEYRKVESLRELEEPKIEEISDLLSSFKGTIRDEAEGLGIIKEEKLAA